MKVIIAFVFLIGAINAIPHPESVPIDFTDERLVSGSIISAIEDLSQSIKDAGLDPLYIKKEAFQYALPVPVIFNCAGFVEEIISIGLSNIKVNRVNYNIITSRLNFDIELPFIHFSVGASEALANSFGHTANGKSSGKVEIHRIRFVGQVRVSVGIISGISIRSITMDFTLGGITSDVNLVVLGKDYSNSVNEFVGATIPEILQQYNKEINELLEIILLELINAQL